MIKAEDELQIGARRLEGYASAYAAWFVQPAIAFVALTVLCLWGIVPCRILCNAGRILGEHWYSVYNGMLLFATILIFVTARRNATPALWWRAWDLTLCCAVISLGGKLIPLDRPDGGPHGFPSGHALTAFAASCLLMKVFPKLSPIAFTIAVAVGWSRVEIREHFTYQVLIGALLGVLVGTGVSFAKDNVGMLLPRLVRRRPLIEGKG